MYLNPFIAPISRVVRSPSSLPEDEEKRQNLSSNVINHRSASYRDKETILLKKHEEASRVVDLLQRRLVNTAGKKSLNSSETQHQRNSLRDYSLGTRAYRHSSLMERESTNYPQAQLNETANENEQLHPGPASSSVLSPNETFGTTSNVPLHSHLAGQPKLDLIRVFKLPPEHAIIQEMRCGFCGTFPRPPVRVCQRGHQTCDSCIGGLTLCPQTQHFSNTPCGARYHKIEYRFYTFLFLNSKLNCPFFVLGCTDTPLGLEFDKHKEECPFRPYVKCPFTNCPIQHTSYVHYVDHVITVHSVPVFQTPECTLSLPFNQTNKEKSVAHSHRSIGAVFQVFGLEFAFVVEEKSSELKMWTASMNNPNIVGNRIFECRFALRSKTSNYMIQWDGEVHARETSSTHIISEHDCFSVSTAILKKKYVFSNEDMGREFWNIDITLTDAKNEKVTEEEVLTQISVPNEMSVVEPVLSPPKLLAFTNETIKNDKQPDLSRLAAVLNLRLKDTESSVAVLRPKDNESNVGDEHLKSAAVDPKHNDTKTKTKHGKTEGQKDKNQMQSTVEAPEQNKKNSAFIIDDLDPKIKPKLKVTKVEPHKTIVPITPSAAELNEEDRLSESVKSESDSSDDDDMTVIFLRPVRPVIGNVGINQQNQRGH